MDEQLKRRLVGAAVVISLGIIFLPMILDGGRHTDFEKIRIEIPTPPERGFSSTIEPLTLADRKRQAIAKDRSVPSADAIDKAGQASIMDEEISRIIKPIEPATKIVNPPAKSVSKSTTGSKPKAPAVTEKKPPVHVKVKAKKIAVTTTASPVSAWVVQVGSFDSRDNAIILRDSLRKNGFVSFVESFEKSGSASHRVRIGPEVERAEAEKVLNNLRKKMSLTGIIVSYP